MLVFKIRFHLAVIDRLCTWVAKGYGCLAFACGFLGLYALGTWFQDCAAELLDWTIGRLDTLIEAREAYLDAMEAAADADTE